MFYDPKTNKYLEDKPNLASRFLYNTIIGRCILKVATTKTFANISAFFLSMRLSKIMIKKTIKNNHIDMTDYIKKDYKSFNDFFTRQIKPEKRKISNGVISICDSKLSIYKLDKDSSFKIKNSIYTINELISEERKYKYALIFRLCVDNYHHYIFPDKGKVIRTKKIKGVLHTVHPISFKKYKVFHENTREITFLECENLGDVCYIEVGALNVGKIINEPKKEFNKGEEKGHFEFGGSTIIMLINKDIEFNKKILENTKKDIETIVKMGDQIGK